MVLAIRKATGADTAALSCICLLTADGGTSAEHLHDFPELPGLIYSVPYLTLPTAWAFVLEETAKNEVVGYIVGSKNTRAYEQYAAEYWWPTLAAKYPPSIAKKPGDVKYTNMLRNMPISSEANNNFAAAHLHINILETYQGQGWGRQLVARAIRYLETENIDGNGVWLAFDPGNRNARKFYHRLGFKNIEGEDENHMGIKFTEFTG